MLKQGKRGGSIVNISSVHSLAVLPGAGPYDAAKWGVVGLGKSIAVELADQRHPGECHFAGPAQHSTSGRTSRPRRPAQSRMRVTDYWNANIPIGRVIEPSRDW